MQMAVAARSYDAGIKTIIRIILIAIIAGFSQAGLNHAVTATIEFESTDIAYGHAVKITVEETRYAPLIRSRTTRRIPLIDSGAADHQIVRQRISTIIG